MAKLSSEKRKNSSFTKKKSLVGLAPGVTSHSILFSQENELQRVLDIRSDTCLPLFEIGALLIVLRCVLHQQTFFCKQIISKSINSWYCLGVIMN